MIKRTIISVLVVCFLLVSLSPTTVQAADEITILNSSAQVDFPYQLNFNLSAASNYEISDIRLRYTVARTSFVDVFSEADVSFTPATTVDAAWSLSLLMIGGLPPGSVIDYWWLVQDTGGNSIETEPVQIEFNDNRYSWQSLSQGKVILYWYQGDQAFAQELMDATQEVLDRLDDSTGASLQESVSIYIYADSAAVQGAMIDPQEWTGGVAFTRYGIIAIGVAENNMAWGKRAIAHELTHLVVHQVTLNPYSETPTWFDEGMAMYSEGPPESWYTSYVNDALAEDKLISVQSLASPFSANTEEARLSYAESYSIVRFLIEEYGRAKMLELLDTFARGATYDGALQEVYSFDMDGLDARWQQYLNSGNFATPVMAKESTPPHIVGIIAGLSTGLLAGVALLVEDWARRRGW